MEHKEIAAQYQQQDRRCRQPPFSRNSFYRAGWIEAMCSGFHFLMDRLQLLLQGGKPDQLCQLFLLGEFLPECRILADQKEKGFSILFFHRPIEVLVYIVLMIVHSVLP